MANPLYLQNSLSLFQHAVSYQEATTLPVSSHLKEQVLAGSSITDLIHTALYEISNEAIAETQEQMSLVMGAKVRDAHGRGRDGRSIEQRRNLAILQKYVMALHGSQVVALEKLVAQFSDAMDRADLIAYFEQAGLDRGRMALVLSALLSRSNLSASQRKKLRDALCRVMEDKSWSLSMFLNMELQEFKPETFKQLKNIYQHAAADASLSLVKWFHQFQEMLDRERKIKILIKALGFELAMQRPSLKDERLGVVISDLQRVLLFLGLGEHCAQVANALPWSKLDGDAILVEILTVMEQLWIGADWLRSRYEQYGFSYSQQYLFAHSIFELIKLLAEPCFRDDEQRDMLYAAYAEYLDLLANHENL